LSPGKHSIVGWPVRICKGSKLHKNPIIVFSLYSALAYVVENFYLNGWLSHFLVSPKILLGRMKR
jgi:hypothetical protein